MTYKDYFLYTEKYWDFDYGFQLVELIVDVVRSRINGYNFNRYGTYGEGSPPSCADPRQHITLRLDLKNQEAIQAVEGKLALVKADGNISDWTKEEDYPYKIRGVTPMRLLNVVYHTAHETATKCALSFYQSISSNSTELHIFQNDKIGYLSDFLPVWLEKSGFRALGGVRPDTSSFKEQLAVDCASSFSEIVDKNRLTDKKKFADRLIHLFLNCICVDTYEENDILTSLGRFLGCPRTYDEICEILGKTLEDCQKLPTCRE